MRGENAKLDSLRSAYEQNNHRKCANGAVNIEFKLLGFKTWTEWSVDLRMLGLLRFVKMQSNFEMDYTEIKFIKSLSMRRDCYWT